MRRGLRKWTHGLLLIGLAVALAACGSGDGEEAVDEEDDSSTAGGLATGTVATPQASLPETVELGEDYTFQMPDGEFGASFSFEAPAGAVVTVTSTAPDGNQGFTTVSVGPAGQAIRRFDLPAGTSESVTYITSADGGGRWNVEISAAPGDVVAFRADAPLQADGGVAGDAGSHAGATTTVELGAPLSGMLGDEDSEDWFAIPLTGGDVVTVSVDMLADDGQGHVSADIVYNGSRVSDVQVSSGGEETMTQIFAEDQVGEAQLRVGGRGNYGFTIEAGPQMDGGTEGDAGGDLSTAKPAQLGLIEGVVGGQDRDDFFVFELPKDAVFTLEATGPPDQLGPVTIELSYNGRRLDRVSISPGQTDGFMAVLVNDPGDVAYLHVQGLGGAYSINLEAVTQPDGGDGTGDAPGEQGQAKEITAEGSFDGVVRGSGGVDQADWYRFTATATAPLDITLSAASGGGNLTMRVRDDTRQIEGLSVSGGGSSTLTIETEAGRDYYLLVQTGTQAAYTVTFG
jgi:hypothetical protein